MRATSGEHLAVRLTVRTDSSRLDNGNHTSASPVTTTTTPSSTVPVTGMQGATPTSLTPADGIPCLK